MDAPNFVARALAYLGMADADARAVIAAGVSVRAVAAASRSLLYVDFLATLAAIPQPVLIVNGTLDVRAMSQEASFVASAPQGSVYHFENCMHGVSMRRPSEFAQVLNAFAGRVLAPAPVPGAGPAPGPGPATAAAGMPAFAPTQSGPAPAGVTPALPTQP